MRVITEVIQKWDPKKVNVRATFLTNRREAFVNSTRRKYLVLWAFTIMLILWTNSQMTFLSITVMFAFKLVDLFRPLVLLLLPVLGFLSSSCAGFGFSWSRGMILTWVAKGPRFKSRTSPQRDGVVLLQGDHLGWTDRSLSVRRSSFHISWTTLALLWALQHFEVSVFFGGEGYSPGPSWFVFSCQSRQFCKSSSTRTFFLFFINCLIYFHKIINLCKDKIWLLFLLWKHDDDRSHDWILKLNSMGGKNHKGLIYYYFFSNKKQLLQN